MRILVTGANGLLGRKLVSLLDRQPEIYSMASARKAISFYTGTSESILLDVTDASMVNDVVLKTRPDVIINAAAMTQVDQCEQDKEECWKQNVGSVTNLVEVCFRNNIHLVHLSTDFIFNGKEGPLDESAIPEPVNYYGESKLEGEKIILNSRCSATIIRTVLVYGVTSDMSRSNIVLWVKKNLEDKKPIRVVNDQYRTPTLAEDLAMGCLLASQKQATGIYHVSGYEMMTPYDIAITTADFFGLDKGLISPATDFIQPAKRPLKTGFIIDKAKRELGYKPHSFSEGLKIVAEQLRELQG
ncbi:MAG TPA: SDR family oxidoreductase [Cyclobacteriaceae bacterium]|nr:SDR family oxidoreductase [Cyclobacteriaceae bacterium]